MLDGPSCMDGGLCLAWWHMLYFKIQLVSGPFQQWFKGEK